MKTFLPDRRRPRERRQSSAEIGRRLGTGGVGPNRQQGPVREGV